MPPDGYETVTLPTTLVEELESLNLGNSHTATIGQLVSEHKARESDTDDTPDPVTLEATEYRKIAEQVEQRLR
jgi:hypothetical protein